MCTTSAKRSVNFGLHWRSEVYGRRGSCAIVHRWTRTMRRARITLSSSSRATDGHRRRWILRPTFAPCPGRPRSVRGSATTVACTTWRWRPTAKNVTADQRTCPANACRWIHEGCSKNTLTVYLRAAPVGHSRILRSVSLGLSGSADCNAVSRSHISLSVNELRGEMWFFRLSDSNLASFFWVCLRYVAEGWPRVDKPPIIFYWPSHSVIKIPMTRVIQSKKKKY